MLFVKLEASDLQRTLGKLMDKLTNKLPLYKTWGRAVELKAKTNARGYGGRRLRFEVHIGKMCRICVFSTIQPIFSASQAILFSRMRGILDGVGSGKTSTVNP